MLATLGSSECGVIVRISEIVLVCEPVSEW